MALGKALDDDVALAWQVGLLGKQPCGQRPAGTRDSTLSGSALTSSDATRPSVFASLAHSIDVFETQNKAGCMDYDKAFWEARYRSAATIWSGHVNPQLVDEVGDLNPGRRSTSAAARAATRCGWPTADGR